MAKKNVNHIKLTLIDGDKPLILNADSIASIENTNYAGMGFPATWIQGSHITMKTKQEFGVKETVNQIYKLIKEETHARESNRR